MNNPPFTARCLERPSVAVGGLLEVDGMMPGQLLDFVLWHAMKQQCGGTLCGVSANLALTCKTFNEGVHLAREYHSAEDREAKPDPYTPEYEEVLAVYRGKFHGIGNWGPVDGTGSDVAQLELEAQLQRLIDNSPVTVAVVRAATAEARARGEAFPRELGVRLTFTACNKSRHDGRWHQLELSERVEPRSFAAAMRRPSAWNPAAMHRVRELLHGTECAPGEEIISYDLLCGVNGIIDDNGDYIPKGEPIERVGEPTLVVKHWREAGEAAWEGFGHLPESFTADLSQHLTDGFAIPLPMRPRVLCAPEEIEFEWDAENENMFEGADSGDHVVAFYHKETPLFVLDTSCLPDRVLQHPEIANAVREMDLTHNALYTQVKLNWVMEDAAVRILGGYDSNNLPFLQAMLEGEEEEE